MQEIYFIPSPDELLQCLYSDCNFRYVYKPSFGLYLVYALDDIATTTAELICSVRMSGQNNNVQAIAKTAAAWLGVDTNQFNQLLNAYNQYANSHDFVPIPLIRKKP